MARQTYYEQCILCGKGFRSPIAEARHRHNAPALCDPIKVRDTKERWAAEEAERKARAITKPEVPGNG